MFISHDYFFIYYINTKHFNVQVIKVHFYCFNIINFKISHQTLISFSISGVKILAKSSIGQFLLGMCRY